MGKFQAETVERVKLLALMDEDVRRDYVIGTIRSALEREAKPRDKLAEIASILEALDKARIAAGGNAGGEGTGNRKQDTGRKTRNADES